MHEIAISDIGGIRIGQVENSEAGTGLTVIVAPAGMAASIDVRGGGPASRDTRILDPLAAAQLIHAVVLGGGSAYGLDAGGGVMRALEERGIGLRMPPATIVPLVCQSDIFDLGVGSAAVRPDSAMGYAAVEAAFTGTCGNYRDGNFGVGCGATVGKLKGPSMSMKAGVGSYAMQLGELQVGAVVVVNAGGDVFDSATGAKVAGARKAADGQQVFVRSDQTLYDMYEAASKQSQELGAPGMTTNTTIGAIITNAQLDKASLCKLAGMAHDGYARAIRPVHTGMDGDSIYGLSVAGSPDVTSVTAPLDVVGILAADVMEHAILRAVYSAEPAFGLPSASSLR